jgi:hypothetical protein
LPRQPGRELTESQVLKSCQPDLGCGRFEKGVSTMEDMLDPASFGRSLFQQENINVS